MVGPLMIKLVIAMTTGSVLGRPDELSLLSASERLKGFARHSSALTHPARSIAVRGHARSWRTFSVIGPQHSRRLLEGKRTCRTHTSLRSCAEWRAMLIGLELQVSQAGSLQRAGHSRPQRWARADILQRRTGTNRSSAPPVLNRTRART